MLGFLSINTISFSLRVLFHHIIRDALSWYILLIYYLVSFFYPSIFITLKSKVEWKDRRFLMKNRERTSYFDFHYEKTDDPRMIKHLYIWEIIMYVDFSIRQTLTSHIKSKKCALITFLPFIKTSRIISRYF